MLIRHPVLRAALTLSVLLAAPALAQETPAADGETPPDIARPAPVPDAAGNPPSVIVERPVPPRTDDRYRFMRMGDGVLRTDGETGQIWSCSQDRSAWSCEIVPDRRAALEDKIARLQSDIDAVRRDVAELKSRVPDASAAPPGPPPADGKTAGERAEGAGDAQRQGEAAPEAESVFRAPTADDIARARAFAAETWGRLVRMVAGLQQAVLGRG